ncbi:MAG: apolipoprotein N-acyltransferase [Rhodobacteraceae bacterium]|nr:apolipoprotein N-acyltransferase [Paracoccaceae bacterium]
MARLSSRCPDVLRGGLGAFLGGALAGLGQPPFGLWPVALAGLLWAGACVLSAPGGRAVALRGWFAGLGFFLVALHWIVEPFLVDVARHGWMAPFGLAGMTGGLALFWAGAAWLVHLAALSPRARPVALAATVSGAEALRGVVFTGFPWALPAHLWAGTPVIHHAQVTGQDGLALLTLLVLALPFVLARRWRRAGVLAAAAALAVFWAGGLWLGARPVLPDGPSPLVRLVQPDAPQHLKWRPDMVPLYFARHLALSARPASAEGPPDLVLWSETAVEFILEFPGDALDRMAAVLPEGALLAFGVRRFEGGRVFNSLAVIDGSADVTHVYDKHHLVPFGEYIPFADLAERLGLTGLAAGGLGFAAGPGPALLDLGASGIVLPLVCYEAIFPYAVSRAARRPDWILQATNDAWFGTFAGPRQHLALARIRAIEQGLPLVRVANTGISAVIDARGNIVAALPLNEAGIIDARVPRAAVPTIHARSGRWPFLAALALVLAALAAWGRRRPG